MSLGFRRDWDCAFGPRHSCFRWEYRFGDSAKLLLLSRGLQALILDLQLPYLCIFTASLTRRHKLGDSFVPPLKESSRIDFLTPCGNIHRNEWLLTRNWVSKFGLRLAWRVRRQVLSPVASATEWYIHYCVYSEQTISGLAVSCHDGSILFILEVRFVWLFCDGHLGEWGKVGSGYTSEVWVE